MRDLTQRLGLWPLLRTARAVIRGDVRGWVERGCEGPAPNIVKIAVVRHFLKKFGLKRFIETGTFYGAMTDAISRLDVTIDTIELDATLAQRARDIFASRPQIRIHEGDSAALLPTILATLEEPAAFWLDAHYSGGITARGELDTPISAELQSILDHPHAHVILIDDARHFVGVDGYPHLHELLEAVSRTGRYSVEVSTDIIRCVGRDLRESSISPLVAS